MELHPRLAADTHLLHESDLGVLLLHRNASIPWLVLVPPGEASHTYELSDELRVRIHEHVDQLARFVVQYFSCARANVAAIGNLVPQLHIHIVGRGPEDPAWPGVVWGAELPEATWEEDVVERLRRDLVEL